MTKIKKNKITDISIEEDLLKDIDELNSILLKLIQSKKSISDRNGKLFEIDCIQSAFSYKPERSGTKSLFHIFLEHALWAEKNCPDSFYEFMKEYLNTKNKILECKKSVICRKADEKDLSAELQKYSQLTQNIITTSLNLTGYAGKISIEKTTSQITSIELNTGYTYNLKPQINCELDISAPLVGIIDGFIDSVSEIDILLREMSESNDYLLLFCRGMSNDVLHTLGVNWENKNLRIIPFFIPVELDTMNYTVDIAAICNCDILSTIKGQLISYFKYSDLTKIKRATVLKNSITLYNDNESKISNHLNNLKLARDKSHADLNDLFMNRIKALSGNHLIIRIPDDIHYISKSSEIDKALRSIRFLINYGVPVEGSLSSYVINISLHKFNKLLNSLSTIIS